MIGSAYSICDWTQIFRVCHSFLSQSFFPVYISPRKVRRKKKALQLPWFTRTVGVYLPAEARPSNTWRRRRPRVWLADVSDRRRGLSSRLTNRGGASRHVETSAARPQIAGSKQPRAERCRRDLRLHTFPRYIIIDDITQKDFCDAHQPVCFMHETALRAQTQTEIIGKTAYFPLFFFFKSWLINNWFFF